VTVGLEPLIADPDSLALAAAALRAGTVVAIPTDTVYGLAADPSQPQAVERLFALKKRPSDVALPVLVAGREQVSAVAGPLDGAAERLAGRYWPGPLTLVVPRRPSFTADLGGPPSARQTVGVRWPDHLVVQALCRELGPLAVTSANRHGGPPATRAAAVAEVFAGEPELTLILDGGLCDGAPSTVVEYRGTALRCLRRGAIPWSDLQEGARGEPDRGSGGPLGAVMPTARSQGSHVPDPLPSPKGPVD
jgi:L-threonylcarbamoyladenylate synthase